MLCLVNREMISKMSQSAQGDIEKGQHVREQLVSTCYMIIHDLGTYWIDTSHYGKDSWRVVSACKR